MGELTSKQFWTDAGIRSIRTMAQAAIGAIGAGAVLSDVDWIQVVSASALAGLLSVLMSLDRIGTGATRSGGNQAPAVSSATAELPQALPDGTAPQEKGSDNNAA